ncbi:glycosyltransferase [Oceanibium sediminis]|uniref:glycosyltransferase n=1 Tax=Oceanibium sediminis TaxID=2026339 RepID=UPI000DD4A113|nr:glycosyltransferase [Oceanibium sediminis]
MTNARPPRILIFAKTYLPGYLGGGPVRSLSNIVEQLGSEFDFRIICRDRDQGQDKPYSGITPGQWVTVGKAEVCYADPSRLSMAWLSEQLSEVAPDALYLNSIFDKNLALRVMYLNRKMRLGLPVLAAPRGQFSSGALALGRVKKRVYLEVLQLGGLVEGFQWQASSDLERDDILKTIRHVNPESISIAPNLPVRELIPGRIDRRPDLSRPLKVVFLSRIVPIKNLRFAIEVVSKITSPVVFTIIGREEDSAYSALCRSDLVNLPDHVSVEFKGPITPESVIDELSRYDIFLLPTLGENFGHVISEALRARLPVLISDQTPWRNLTGQGVGWDVPLKDVQDWTLVLDEVAGWGSADWRRVDERIGKFVNALDASQDVLEANRFMFRQLIS